MRTVEFGFKSQETKIVEIATPVPAEDEILVKVHYSALDTSATDIIDRNMASYFVHSSKSGSLNLGYHFSGIIEAVGSSKGDEKLKKGTEVYGFLQYEPTQKQGAFSDFITVKKDALAVKPASVSHEICAASTTEALTAIQSMRDIGGLSKGESVLVVGAAGGVGSAAVQIAKAMGARVTGVCSARDVSRVEAWGADVVINRSEQPNYVNDLKSTGEKFNVIFNTPNTLPLRATGLLTADGTLVNTIPNTAMLFGKVKTLLSKKRVTFVEVKCINADLEVLTKWLEQEALKIDIDSKYKVCNMQKALERQRGRKQGRVIVQVAEGWD